MAPEVVASSRKKTQKQRGKASVLQHHGHKDHYLEGLRFGLALALRRAHLHHSELVQCADWVRLLVADNWRNELLYRAGDIERDPGLKRAPSSRGRDVLVQDVTSTAAQGFDGAVAYFEIFERHGLEEFVRRSRSP